MAGIVLAGGHSVRFGSDKALALLRGKPLIDYVLDELAPAAGRLFIVTDSLDRFNAFADKATVVLDEIPGLGPIGGLYSGLKASPDTVNAVCPCDAPFVDRGLIEFMIREIGDSDAVVPSWQGRLHPAHGVYAKSCLIPIEASIDSGAFRIVSFFDKVKVKYINDDTIKRFNNGSAFFNVNTPGDLDKAELIMFGQGDLNA